MTLNAVIALILHFSPHSIALLANYVTVVEGKPMSVNIVSQFQSSTFAITNPPCSAVSATAELLVTVLLGCFAVFVCLCVFVCSVFGYGPMCLRQIK